MPAEKPYLIDDDFFNKLRKKEYAKLDKFSHVYLDYTGGNIHPKCLVNRHYRFLQRAIYGNPHSSNPASLLSEEMIKEARQKVLEFFNAPEYYCVFTQNASGALQIVGECYPFSSKSHFLLTADNHNSVNGIRQYCLNSGCNYTYSAMHDKDLTINEAELRKQLSGHQGKANKLFAYPAQSNASGVQHSLAWIEEAKELGWDVLLDAAAYVPTSRLDLSVIRPDFVSISFYKIFGYPTGIGCLLVKKSTFDKLEKPWFAGGTITASGVKHNGYLLKADHERFENGTVNYLAIPAIVHGLEFISNIQMNRISARIKNLCRWFLQELLQLSHDNGLPLIKIYGPRDMENRGGTILLNFFDFLGLQYACQCIEQQANAHNISLRTGCFCNPGIDEINNNFSADHLKDYFSSNNQGDRQDMTQLQGRMRGAVRLSIGIPTTLSDINMFIQFAKTFLNKSIPGAPTWKLVNKTSVNL